MTGLKSRMVFSWVLLNRVTHCTPNIWYFTIRTYCSLPTCAGVVVCLPVCGIMIAQPNVLLRRCFFFFVGKTYVSPLFRPATYIVGVATYPEYFSPCSRHTIRKRGRQRSIPYSNASLNIVWVSYSFDHSRL